MSSGDVGGQDYRSRFAQYKALEGQKDALIAELLDRLESVQAERDVIKADLEVEQDARRRLQRDVSRLQGLEKTTNKGRFIVVLIDADADIYVFHEKFLTRGERGGQEAAEELMLKVRKYLHPSMKDAETITVMVKAFANLTGLGQACVKNNKVKSEVLLSLFVIGFNRRYPLFDFVDVGPGKEEADNKLRDVLNIYVPNSQCQHIILGCCHDQGYVPFLRQFEKGSSVSQKITLLQSGPLPPRMESLGFKKTDLFNSLFSSEIPSSTSSSPTPFKSFPHVNSVRLGPIIRNSSGKRIDKELSVDSSLLQRMKAFNLCSCHYLREDCVQKCRRSHAYARPLSLEEHDAVWYLARSALCKSVKQKSDCNDDRCIYGHRRS